MFNMKRHKELVVMRELIASPDVPPGRVASDGMPKPVQRDEILSDVSRDPYFFSRERRT